MERVSNLAIQITSNQNRKQSKPLQEAFGSFPSFGYSPTLCVIPVPLYVGASELQKLVASDFVT